MLKRIKRFLARLGFTGLALILVPLLVTIMWLRFFGLPEQMKERLITELAGRGLIVEVDRLLLDPSGGVLAKKMTVYRNASRDQVWVQLDQARIGFAWFSWWQDRSFIESASVANATVSLPITSNVAMTLHHVSAAVDFQGKELLVRGVEAQWHQIQLAVQGRIQVNGLPPSRERTPEQIASLEKLWKTVESYAEQIDGENPIQLRVEFDLPTLTPQLGKAEFALSAKRARYRQAQIEEFSLVGRMAEGLVSLEDFRIKLARGELGLAGEWDLARSQAKVEFSSNLDFTPLAFAFEGRARDIVNRLNFTELPQISGQVRVDWSQHLVLNIQTDLDWRDFSYSNVRFNRLIIPLGYDGRRWLIPQAEIVNASGSLVLDGYVDEEKPLVKIKVTSTLDPTGFEGLFGAGVDRFLRSCHFPETGPSLKAVIDGASLQPLEWKITGVLGSKKFAYKEVPIEEATTDFVFQNQQFQTENLYVRRKEGKLNGKLLWDFKDRWANMKDFTSTLTVHEVAPILGAKFTSYMAPYRFSGPPALKVNGKVDLNATKPSLDTNLSVEVEGVGMTVGFDVFRKPIEIKNPKGTIVVVNRELRVALKAGEFCEGKIDGVMIFNMTPGQSDFQMFLNLNKNNFQQAASTLFGYKDATGVMTSSAKFKGIFGKTETITGNGKLVVDEGDIMSIPVFGGLSGLLNAVIPNFAFTRARNARSTFELKDGKVVSEDFEITSPTFSVIGHGSHDFIKDNLDFDIRVNIRGIFGVVFFPVSKLFEYHGSGSLKSPHWEAKIFQD